MNKSPAPKRKSISKMMTFPQALIQVKEGNKITKFEWENPAEYIFLKDGFLCIHHSGDEEGKFHRLLVSEGDLVGEDWMLITEEDVFKN